MLLIVMVIAGVLAGWLLVTRRHGWGSFALVVMLFCQGVLLLDTQQHFGTTVKTETLTSKIAPIASVKGNHLLVTERIKRGKTRYTAYATRHPQTQRTQLILNHQKTVRIVTGVPTNQVAKVTKNRRYQYQTVWAKWLFSGVTTAGQLQRQTVTYRLSASWQVLTKSQLTTLSRRLKQKSTQVALKKTVKQQVAAKIKTNPELASQQAILVKSAEQSAVRQLIRQIQGSTN